MVVELDVDMLVETHHAERERGAVGHVGLRVETPRVRRSEPRTFEDPGQLTDDIRDDRAT